MYKEKPFIQKLPKEQRNNLRKEWNLMMDFLKMPEQKTKRRD